MRVPVALALAVPILAVGSAAAVYRFGRPVAGHLRTYYIAADELASRPAAGAGADAGYRSAVYREYTDSTFTRIKPRPAEWRHLDFLGPLIRASVGDTVRVVFRNHAAFPANLHPDGVLFHEDDEQPQSGPNVLGWDRDDTAVAPGSQRTYLWAVPAEAGPHSDDHGSMLWMYHSQTAAPAAGAGLIGPMLVYPAGSLAGDPGPR
jgi:FtsP/CotA-like multicopper oxidase with cupredoxin domain